MAKAVYRSALRSKRLLRDAFSDLLREKDYSRITVTEVVERADLNRSTFYAHYTCMDDLMHEVLDEVSGDLFAVLKSAVDNDFLRHPEPTLALMGDILKRERSLYFALSETRHADTFMQNLFTERIHREWGYFEGQPGPVGLIAFVASGAITLYRSWLSGSLGDVPIEEANRVAAIYVKALGAAFLETAW